LFGILRRLCCRAFGGPNGVAIPDWARSPSRWILTSAHRHDLLASYWGAGILGRRGGANTSICFKHPGEGRGRVGRRPPSTALLPDGAAGQEQGAKAAEAADRGVHSSFIGSLVAVLADHFPRPRKIASFAFRIRGRRKIPSRFFFLFTFLTSAPFVGWGGAEGKQRSTRTSSSHGPGPLLLAGGGVRGHGGARFQASCGMTFGFSTMAACAESTFPPWWR